MSLVKRRLIDLWRRQTPNPPAPWPSRFPGRMLVTIRVPMKISGTVLVPGRYAFLMFDPGAERNLVQIFNEDQTRLIATLTTVLEN